MNKDDASADEFDAPPLPEFPPGLMPHPYLGMMGEQTANEGDKAEAGDPLDPETALASEEDLIEALKTVHDPEIPVNIYDLGLIYECSMNEGTHGDWSILMTLTAPACPVAGEMPMQVAQTVAAVDGVGKVTVTLTWTPPWEPSRMSDDARMALDIW